jgi:hypothetical protein
MPLQLTVGVSAVVGGWAKQTSKLQHEQEVLRQREQVLEGEMQAAQLLLVSSALNMRQAQQLSAEAEAGQHRGGQQQVHSKQQQSTKQQQQQQGDVQQSLQAAGLMAEDAALYYACVQPFPLVACACLVLLCVVRS